MESLRASPENAGGGATHWPSEFDGTGGWTDGGFGVLGSDTGRGVTRQKPITMPNGYRSEAVYRKIA